MLYMGEPGLVLTVHMVLVWMSTIYGGGLVRGRQVFHAVKEELNQFCTRA
jgi:hypothetical protein